MAGGGERWDGERIGVLGGTFDPPHIAHLHMAAAARDTLDLAQVYFAPAPHPPHKSDDVTDYPHRVAMTEAAIAGEARMSVTHIESEHETSYTVNMLRAIRARTRADIYFILGADALDGLPSWREPEEILRLATLVVFPRDGVVVRAGVAGDASLVVFDSPPIDVSSTDLRARIARGDDTTAGLPLSVARYIAHHRLYARA